MSHALINALEDALRRREQDKATSLIAQVIKATRSPLDALNNIGVAHKRAGLHEAAIGYYRQALLIEPTRGSALCNIALAHKELGNLSEAEACCRLALLNEPASQTALYNLGIILKSQGRFAEARENFAATLGRDPAYADAEFDLALVELLLADFSNGWKHYEARFNPRLKNPQKTLFPEMPIPRWIGGDPKGQRLVLVHEQGFGDQIQFCRYANLLAGRGAEVTLVVKPELVTLMQSLQGGVKVLASGAEFDWRAHDAWAPLMSLPTLIGGDVAPQPCPPYLRADPDKVAAWTKRIGEHAGGRRAIGLVWAGSPTHARDHERSLKAEDFAVFADVPDTCFVSIQKGPRSADVARLQERMPVLDIGADLKDFSDTAAVLCALDLLVCVDTSAAHLAGALGRPAWVLIPFVPDWRWLTGRDDSPWYGSLRLFREPNRQGWPKCLAGLRRALAERMGAEAETAARS